MGHGLPLWADKSDILTEMSGAPTLPLCRVSHETSYHEIRTPSPNVALLAFFRHCEAVADPRFGQQVTGLGRLRLDFLA